jgi:isocitrate dehydrogenase (NAD+)
MILASLMMLRHIGETEAADRIENSLFSVYRQGIVRTPDLGGTAKTTEMIEAIIHEMMNTDENG